MYCKYFNAFLALLAGKREAFELAIKFTGFISTGFQIYIKDIYWIY